MRRREWEGRGKNKKWGNILKIETSKNETKVTESVSEILKTDCETIVKTELNKSFKSQEIFEERHEIHGKGKTNENLKRKIKDFESLKSKKNVQEQKGEGGTRGHCDRDKKSEPEKLEENVQKVLLQVVGGASRKCMEKTRKSAGKSFKGGPFADKEKGQVFDRTEDHVVGPNQTWKSDKY